MLTREARYLQWSKNRGDPRVIAARVLAQRATKGKNFIGHRHTSNWDQGEHYAKQKESTETQLRANDEQCEVVSAAAHCGTTWGTRTNLFEYQCAFVEETIR